MTRSVTVSEERIALPGHNPLPYRLRRDPRRKRACLVVTAAGELELRAPPRAPKRELESFLRANADWALARLAAAAERPAAPAGPADGDRLPLLDESLELRLTEGSAGVRRSGDLLLAPARRTIPHLEVWYRQAAYRHLMERLNHFGPRIGVAPARLTIRSQRTRWGSCSSRGGISLNWRLLFAPAAAADYVVVHELCHLHHMNHSPEFWALVTAHAPDYAHHRRTLKALRPPF